MRLLTLTIIAALAATILPAQTVEERLRKLEVEHRALLDAHSKEIERLQFGSFVPALGDGKFGMGPAASKVYGQDEGLSIGGYGEFLYEQRSGNSDRFDALRTVLYVGYRFDENWLFNSEFEYEHGTTSSSSGTSSSGGSVSVEFSYIEYLHDESFNARGGLLLVPMGLINEMHEPTTFLAAARPQTEQRIIPSTWRETGVSAHGTLGEFDYKAAVITSLNGEEFDSSGLRGGRQKGNKSAADDFAFVGRLDWNCCEGFTVGGSVFIGDTGQDGADSNGNSIPSMRTVIAEGHVEYESNGLVIRGLYAGTRLNGTGTFNTNTMENLAEGMEGYYVELGYDLMHASGSESGAALLPFVRWEHIDTQAQMAPGFARERDKEDTILTIGLHYRPIDQIVMKVDFQSFDRGKDVFQIGFGYVF